MRCIAVLPIALALAACAGNETATSVTLEAPGTGHAVTDSSSAAVAVPAPAPVAATAPAAPPAAPVTISVAPQPVSPPTPPSQPAPPVPLSVVMAPAPAVNHVVAQTVKRPPPPHAVPNPYATAHTTTASSNTPPAMPPSTTASADASAAYSPGPSTAPTFAPGGAAAPAGPIAFATRHASYETANIADLPGWHTDDLDGIWDAFRRSCAVLRTHTGWSEPCTAANRVNARNPVALHAFFETWFNAYRIHDPDQATNGTLTGYYEPQLDGADQSSGAYVYPVYGTPDDMLYLDARRVPAGTHDTPVIVRVSGHTVIPVSGAAAGSGTYVLDLRNLSPDIRDKQYRLRIDHDHVVPYYSRAEIENGELHAPVLAYVDDPVMLYSMQVQGSGKIRMRDGSIRRVAYAEQNGYPFIPPVSHNAGGDHKIAVRGIDMDIDVSNDTSNPGAGASGDSGDDDQPVSTLLRGFALAEAAGAPTGGAKPKSKAHANTAPVVIHHFATSDPSYVFFRLIPDSPNGPTGALGVPLAPGRSVAVDPRTTPLGAPVYLSTGVDSTGAGSINRLMMAQDTGGAIRGPIRADYFYGFGQNAQAQASHTKAALNMWVLLPKGLHVNSEGLGPKTRGVGGAPESNADCLVADPVLCVDDSQ